MEESMEAIKEVNAAPIAATNGSGGDVMDLMRMCMDRMSGESATEAVAVMKDLIEMKRGLDRDAAKIAFSRAFAKFQAECPTIKKTSTAKITSKRTGGSFSYSYADLAEIDVTVRPKLTKHGFSFSWNCQEGEKSILAICTLRHEDGHSEESTFPAPIESTDRMSGSQAYAAALTYAKRQSLVQVLGITTADKDTDGIGPSGRRETAEKITKNQAADIEAVLDEMKLDRGAFLKWAKADRVENILASNYEEVMDALEAKRKAREAATA